MNYDQFIAALCIWREARGEPYEAKLGVWHVIRNRAADPAGRWPKTISGVIAERHQFSSMTFLGSKTAPADPNLAEYPIEPAAGAESTLDWEAFLDCQGIASNVNDDDPTSGANAYESLPEGAAMPAWANTKNLTDTLGSIRFYKI